MTGILGVVVELKVIVMFVVDIIVRAVVVEVDEEVDVVLVVVLVVVNWVLVPTNSLIRVYQIEKL